MILRAVCIFIIEKYVKLTFMWCQKKYTMDESQVTLRDGVNFQVNSIKFDEDWIHENQTQMRNILCIGIYCMMQLSSLNISAI